MARPKISAEQKKLNQSERNKAKYQKDKERLKGKYQENKEKLKEQRRSKYQEQKEQLKSKYQDDKEKNMMDNRTYERSIREGPSYDCYSCQNLWFKRSLSLIDTTLIPDIMKPDIRGEVFFACFTCAGYLKKSLIPPLFHRNGLDLPIIPEYVSCLNSIEERMTAPIIPFMTITGGLSYQDGVSKGQKKMKGNVVTVPTPLETTLRILPRLPNDCNLVNVFLKRRIKNEHAYIAQQVDPNQVKRALSYLIKQPLYIEHGISSDPKWQEEIERLSKIESLDELGSNDVDDLPCTADTLVVNDNMYLGYAPGEGQRPINLLMTPFAEELCFPTLFGGQKMEHNYFDYEKAGVKIPTVSAIVKHQLRNKDKRFSRNSQNIFFKFSKQLLSRIYSAEQTQLRKAKQTKYTVAELKDQAFVEKLYNTDEAYKFTKSIPSSPAFWQETKNEVLAMIRQFGVPTLFVTLSPTEYKWPELLVLLAKSVDGKTITEEESMCLSYLEKDRLLRSDPVLVTRYNDERFRCLFKVMKSAKGPFKRYPIENHFYRVEFQARGSPHFHCLLWLQNAPNLNLDNPESFSKIVEFADELITCSKTKTRYSEFQNHKHTHTCYRNQSAKNRGECRFDIPSFPIESTTLLVPLTSELCSSHAEDKLRASHIKAYLTENVDADQELILKRFNISYDVYVRSIRCYIKRTRLLMKRSGGDSNMNNYNHEILDLHRSNMDIQIIFDAYAVCSYVVNYINKSSKSMSKILRTVAEQAQTSNKTNLEKLRQISYAFVDSHEISVQEVIYSMLSMNFTNCSTSSIFIASFPELDRHRMLKSSKELMSNESEDIFKENIFEKYAKRPETLESVTLAEFATEYEKIGGTYRMRKQRKILRYVSYSRHQDELNYIREQLLLFCKWRIEPSSESLSDMSNTFHEQEKFIQEVRMKFQSVSQSELDEAMNDVDEKGTDIEPETSEMISKEDFVLSLIPNKQAEIIADTAETNEKFGVFRYPDMMDSSNYNNLIYSLNTKQRRYLYHSVAMFKKGEQFIHYLAGSAGVGKSVLISAIYQTITKLSNSLSTRTDTTKVLLTASTGKASFNIGGDTLHHAFSLPVNQYSGRLARLSSSVANTLSCQMVDVQFLVIDEISMVGCRTLSHINQRLQQIKGNDLKFGGVSVIAVGDLKQLPPVGDSPIFRSDPLDPYSFIIENTSSLLWRSFDFYELDQIMRQRDDLNFATALNHFGENQLTAGDIELFNSRILHGHSLDEAVHLFYTNAEVDSYNMERLNRLNTESHLAVAHDKIEGHRTNKEMKSAETFFRKSKTSETYGLPYSVLLKIEGRYVITNNVDTADGLTNGCVGTLEHVSLGTKSIGHSKIEVPMIAWLRLDGKSGSKLRSSFLEKRDGLTPIQLETKTIQLAANHKIKLIRTQFPLVPAFALTIHKSQGQSYDNVTVHLKPGMSRSLVYVALSRSKTLQGLSIVISGSKTPSFNSIAVLKESKANNLVDAEIFRLRSNVLRTEWEWLYEKPGFKIISHNIQSFEAHRNLLSSDEIFISSDLVILTETWLHSDPAVLDNWELKGSLHCESNERAKGIIVLGKKAIECNVIKAKRYHQNGKSIDLLAFRQRDMDIVAVYKQCGMTTKTMVDILNQFEDDFLCDSSNCRTYIGDFNTDFNVIDRNLASWQKQRSLRSVIESNSSNDKNTLIDNCLTTDNRLAGYVYEDLCSYHKPIIVFIE